MYIQRLQLMFLYYPVPSCLALFVLAVVGGLLVGWPFLVAVACVAGAAALVVNRQSRNEAKRIADLKRRWGTRDERDRDFDDMEGQYLTLARDDSESDVLDASTWTDLDMDAVFGELDKLVFDYRLKPGICASGNAIRTLGWLGFPDAVVNQAREQLSGTQKEANRQG